jgi:glycogen synthase
MFVASDFLLMPSRFEPCGLSQMYAQRCGTLPIACRTGGLADTIDDDSSGFLFPTANANGLISALQRALGGAFIAIDPNATICAPARVVLRRTGRHHRERMFA